MNNSCVQILLFLVLIYLNQSCTSDEGKASRETQLTGKWKLIEQLLDPGDGSGTFRPVSSDRIIEFFSDGSVEVNGILCFMSSEVGEKKNGTYILNLDANTDLQNDGEITPHSCSSRSAKVYFDLPLDGSLIIWYTCIEPCAQKFKKID